MKISSTRQTLAKTGAFVYAERAFLVDFLIHPRTPTSHTQETTLSKTDYVFTSESVSEGHPDKVSDRISDSIVDLCLKADPQSRIALETLCTTNLVVLAGEVRVPASVTHEAMIQSARDAIKDIGYEQEGFHWKNAKIECHVHAQSADIAVGVDSAGNKDEGAGDQGIMFGYAVNETREFMPAPIQYSHAILQSLAEARHDKDVDFLGPDAKSQLSLQYVGGKPVRCTSVVVSTQHSEKPARKKSANTCASMSSMSCPRAGCATTRTSM